MNNVLTHVEHQGLSFTQRLVKRSFDLCVSIPGLMLVSPIVLVGWLAAAISTRSNGFFIQKRVGKNGKLFPLIKLRSMRQIAGLDSTVTTSSDSRITATGAVLRKFKVDELPQLINVILGHMSLVGPRPDVEGYADQLQGEDRLVLSVRPGVTGPASIRFRREEEILAKVDDPEQYNRHVIWPEKVRLNLDYIRNYSLSRDIQYILQTAFGSGTEI